MTLETYPGPRADLLREFVGDARSLLDVGCRDRRLRHELPEQTRYVGLDLAPPADVVASAEEPLPFEDATFAVVVLADVLEHLEQPQRALDEAMRVAADAVVLLLPNVGTLVQRAHFALHGRFSGGKYVFAAEHPGDRHRWVLNVSDGRAFAAARATAFGWHVAREAAQLRPFNRIAARAAYAGARRLGSADLWAWSYAARLEPLR